MSKQLVVTLDDDVYQRAEQLAHLTRRGVDEVVAQTLDLSLPLWQRPIALSVPVRELPDVDVLVLADLQMETVQDRHLSELLDRQQAGQLQETERPVLLAMMQFYQEGLLLKALALQEAVQRGLREPLAP